MAVNNSVHPPFWDRSGRGMMEGMNATISAAASGTYLLGGDLPVHRLGFGVMQLPGPGVWGPSPDPDNALRVLRRAVELGVNLIDTADAYGPFTADHYIREALRPYPADLVIATKVGFTRQGPGQWMELGLPIYLRHAVEINLTHLGLDRIDLLQLHRIGPQASLEDQVGELADLQREGKIRHIGLSEVSVEQLERARAVAPIVSVQNRYNFVDRQSEDVLEYCEREGIAFIPWFPLHTGGRVTPQIALAWLLRRSPVMLPIPGTSSLEHLEENIAAAGIVLSDEEYAAL